MSRHPELYQWKAELARYFPILSPAQVGLLALWSLGMILARSCGLVRVATHLAPLLGQSFNTLRQRLREFYQEAHAKAGVKRGIKRRDFDVTECFVPLLAWVLSYWTQRRLALALDVTNLSDRLHVLCVSVLFGGIGIPVAWKILPGNQPDAWHPHWCDLLQRLRQAVGDDWQVVVLSDRGLESARLFTEMVRLGWHPLMRAKGIAKFRPHGWKRWYPLAQFAPRVGSRCALAGEAYKTAKPPLSCTLLTLWEAGHEGPWLLLTDLEANASQPCWYAWRAWIEQGFKVIKSAGFQWQHTRMRQPDRLERLWLALAVTTLWLVAVGAEEEQRLATETLAKLPAPPLRVRMRKQRLTETGWAMILAAWLRGMPLPRGRLTEVVWPEDQHDLPLLTEENFVRGQTYS
jgi:hypothetical protein